MPVEYGDLIRSAELEPNEDAFGFLWEPWRISTPQVCIEPLPDHAELKAQLLDCAVDDGGTRAIYPPICETWRSIRGDEWEPVPNSARPSAMYPPIISHRLIYPKGTIAADQRVDVSTFVILFLSYLGGTRLQLHNHYIDTRLVIRPAGPSFIVQQRSLGVMLQRAINRFDTLSGPRQKFLLTALYLHVRAQHEPWHWLSFVQQYMAFDALRGAAKRGGASVERWCAEYGIPIAQNDLRLVQIEKMRNELFHDGLFADAIPGYSITQNEWDAMLNLQALNERLIAGLLKIGAIFCSSDWSDRMPHALES